MLKPPLPAEWKEYIKCAGEYVMKNKINSTLTIVGTTFDVDIETQRLVEKDNPANAISFIDQMTDFETHYRMFYEPGLKNTPRHTYNPDTMQEINVPKLVELDPQGMAERFGYAQEELRGKTDFEVMVNQEALNKRHQGVLPQIDIAGEKFVVDLLLQILRHAENNAPVLDLKAFGVSDDGLKYVAYYNPVSRQVVDIDPKLTEFPDHVLKIQIPGETGLDPVAAAKMYGVSERDLLRRFPIEKDLKAELIPLSETEVPAMIQRNREQLMTEHETNARKIKPYKRHRF